MEKKLRFNSATIHGGQSPDPAYGAVMPPIYQTSTYAQTTPGGHKGFEYSRTHNPTRQALEKSLASIENGKHGLAFASGLAAMDAVMKLLQPGDVIVSNINSFDSGNCFNASVVVTSNDSLIAGRQYLARIHNKETKITITKIRKKINIDSGKALESSELLINDIGEIEFDTNEKIVFTKFDHSKQLGSFIIIDLENNNVVSAGKINFALRRSGNIFQNQFEINKISRAKFLKQSPKCIWFTGISGSGKTTIASALEKSLFKQNKLTYFLDADNLRAGINKDLGFTQQDRVENIRRIAEIAKLMVDAGLIVIVAAISPYVRERQFAKTLFDKKEFFEVFVNTPLNVCLKRDPKVLYKKAKKDKNMNKTGLGANYEKPRNPNLEIDTSKQKTDEIVKNLIKKAFS